MTMHMEGPWLSTTGRRKGKVKFKNAEQARKARELDESWKELLKKYGAEQEEKRRKRAMSSPVWQPEKPFYRGASDPKIPSLNGGIDMQPAVKATPKVYTGTKVKGIATMHKSNAVPIFTDEEAIDVAKMRR